MTINLNLLCACYISYPVFYFLVFFLLQRRVEITEFKSKAFVFIINKNNDRNTGYYLGSLH